MTKSSQLHILLYIVCLTGYNDALPKSPNLGTDWTIPKNPYRKIDLTDMEMDSNGHQCLNVEKVNESNRLTTSALTHINTYADKVDDLHYVQELEKKSRGSDIIEKYNKLVKELKAVIYKWKNGDGIYFNIKHSATLSKRFNTYFSINFKSVEEFVKMKQPSEYHPDLLLFIEKVKSSGITIPEDLRKSLLAVESYESEKERVTLFLSYLQTEVKIMKKQISDTHLSLTKFRTDLSENKSQVNKYLSSSESKIKEINAEIKQLTKELDKDRDDIFSEVNAELKIYENMKSKELKAALKEIEDKINKDMYRDIGISVGVGLGGALAGPILKYAGKHVIKHAAKLGSRSLKALKETKKAYIANKVPQGANRVKKYFNKKIAQFKFPLVKVASSQLDKAQKAYLGLKIGASALVAGTSIAAFSYSIYAATEMANQKIIKEQLKKKIEDAVDKEIIRATKKENIKDIESSVIFLGGLETKMSELKPYLVNSINGVKQLDDVFSALENLLKSLRDEAKYIKSRTATIYFVEHNIKNLKNCWSNIHSRTSPFKT